jgi:hypothetical protein
MSVEGLCQSTAELCACDPFAPVDYCKSPYDICCDKGQGNRCYASADGCT